jgi:hypothetical protein
MGRADVLLRFLQLVGKDSPKELEPFLAHLDQDTEKRPLTDQLVDLIIAGNENLYEKYAQARQEAGSRNPYSSPDEQATPEYDEALGRFLARWIELEVALRRHLGPDARGTVAFNPISMLAHAAEFDDSLSRNIKYIRQMRNQVVHGMRTPHPSELLDASRVIQDLISHFAEDTSGSSEDHSIAD